MPRGCAHAPDGNDENGQPRRDEAGDEQVQERVADGHEHRLLRHQGLDHEREPDAPEEVENVGAQRIAHRHVDSALPRNDDGAEAVGERRADGQHTQTEELSAETQIHENVLRDLDDEVGDEPEPNDAHEAR
mmetsp:Transcript_17544/g.25786  ORF Transcript_17544/g.25786 Transcript_17544/m.25786 type:complete len:132 (-) Transcript_17544:105-500(-)